MRKTFATAPRRMAALLTAALVCVLMSVGATTAGAQTQSNGLESNQCAVFMGWMTTVHSPALGSPYSAYPAFLPKAAAQLDDTAFVISQDFPYVAYGGWFLYPAPSELPTGITYAQMTPDPGNVNPFTEGTPIFAKKRHYQMILTANSATDLAPNLQKIANRNHSTWAAGTTNWFVLGRNYNAFAGYAMSGTGGPTNTAWPDIRTYNAKTGKPVPCDPVQTGRDEIQQLTPWNTQGVTGDNLIPHRFRPMMPQFAGGKQFWPPKKRPALVEFYRMPGNGTRAPNNTVPAPADNCANYVEARLNSRQIALIRIPHIAQFQSHTPAADAVYQQTEAGAISYSAYGQLTSTYRQGSAFSYAVGNEDIIQDETGGATIVVWPRSLSPAVRRTVFAYARSQGWNLLQGNTSGPQYANMMTVRVNGPAPTYQGGLYHTDCRTGAPCMLGPQDTLDPFGLTVVPVGTPFMDIPDDFVATPDMLGESTPQGVQCEVAGYLGGNCLDRLMQYMDDTGGAYYAGESSENDAG
jgi:hypothetical protein